MKFWLKKLSGIITILIVFTLLSQVGYAYSMIPYESYTYSYWGQVRQSPHAYAPEYLLEGSSLGIEALRDPQDIFVDSNNNVYIADAGNNRILCLDENLEISHIISGFYEEDPEQIVETMSGPSGVFVTDDDVMYVADTNNSRIIVSDIYGKIVTIVPEPVADVFPDDFIYTPASIVVDNAGRIYVIAKNTNLGVVAMTQEGEFLGFMGARRVVPNLTDIFWRFFMTPEQIERTRQQVPTEYNNIALDDSGFLFVTSSAIEQWAQYSAILSRSRSGDYAPVRRLNPSGEDVLKRTGFHPPAGDVDVLFRQGSAFGTSLVVDVALNDKMMYTILDSRRNKLFTYDEEGNLLYVFGGTGRQLGLFQRATAIAYLNDDILVLDSQTGMVTKFILTEYGELIHDAILATRNRQFDVSLDIWQKIVQYNSNFDMAYLAMGNTSYRDKDFDSAMSFYRSSNNWEGYSRAYRQVRKDFLSRYFLLVPLLMILLVIITYKLFKKAKEFNDHKQQLSERSGIKDELIYAAHIIFHPFDGFYDMKYEKRGSIKAAAVLFALAVISFVVRNLITGYIFNPYRNETFDFMSQVLYVAIPVILWCLANWSLTTLMDGEGSMKDIFMMTSYALTPIIILNVPIGIMSNFMIREEEAFLTFFSNLAFGWTLLLIFVGVMIIHNYTIPKNILTTAFSVGGMVVITFIVLLYFGLLQQLVAFISNISTEILFRL